MPHALFIRIAFVSVAKDTVYYRGCSWDQTSGITFHSIPLGFYCCRNTNGRNQRSMTLILDSVVSTWWRHEMEVFSASMALRAGNSPVTGGDPSQRPVTRSFDVFTCFWIKRSLSKQPWGWWFETPSRSLWRHGNWWICRVEYSSGTLFQWWNIYLYMWTTCESILLKKHPIWKKNDHGTLRELALSFSNLTCR